MQLCVTKKELVAANTSAFRFESDMSETLPSFQSGAHIEISFARFVRRYSLTSPTSERGYYEICVLKTEPSAGGSAYLHDHLEVGDNVEVSEPLNAFRLNDKALNSIFIAGGIGITPFFTMMSELHSAGSPFELHYAARTRERFLPIPAFVNQSHKYTDTAGRSRLDIDRLISSIPENADIYACGPRALIEAVREKTAAAGWTKDRVHYESFGAAPTFEDQELTVQLARSGETMKVSPGTTILEALLENDVWMSYECQRGECGFCIAEVLSGLPDHRDICLNEKQRLKFMCTCVSWAHGDELILNL